MRRLARQAAAWAIITGALGLAVEAALPDGRLSRAPLTGAMTIGAAAILGWAVRELELDVAADTT